MLRPLLSLARLGGRIARTKFLRRVRRAGRRRSDGELLRCQRRRALAQPRLTADCEFQSHGAVGGIQASLCAFLALSGWGPFCSWGPPLASRGAVLRDPWIYIICRSTGGPGPGPGHPPGFPPLCCPWRERMRDQSGAIGPKTPQDGLRTAEEAPKTPHEGSTMLPKMAPGGQNC